MTAFDDAPAGHLVAGEWLAGGALASSTNPATDGVLGRFYDAGPDVAEMAIAAATDAFVATSWRTDHEARANVLWSMAEAIERNRERLAQALTLENGKTIAESCAEVGRSSGKLRHAAGLALTDLGSSGVSPTGELSVVIKQPIGVAGIIVPWNSPIILAVRGLAPALAAGCTVVVKMPAQTALTGALLADVLTGVPGLPAGVINVVTESGDHLARTLVSDPRVGVVSFTGSTATGVRIMAAAASTLTRLSLELGGKTPMIVLPDADLDKTVPALVSGTTRFAGQFCMAGNRVIVHRKIADEVAQRLREGLAAVVTGPGLDPATEMGPLIDHDAVRRVDGLVHTSIKAERGELLLEGGPTPGQGSFYRPTLVRVADDSPSTLLSTETFGPVATLEVVDHKDEAVARANATPYGLAASVWTSSDSRAQRMCLGLQMGTVWINTWGRILDRFEEGGHKASGLGRLGGTRGIAEFQELKHVLRGS